MSETKPVIINKVIRMFFGKLRPVTSGQLIEEFDTRDRAFYASNIAIAFEPASDITKIHMEQAGEQKVFAIPYLMGILGFVCKGRPTHRNMRVSKQNANWDNYKSKKWYPARIVPRLIFSQMQAREKQQKRMEKRATERQKKSLQPNDPVAVAVTTVILPPILGSDLDEAYP